MIEENTNIPTLNTFPLYQRVWNNTPWPLQELAKIINECALICLAASTLVAGIIYLLPTNERVIKDVLFAPVLEEIAFRGLLQPSIKYAQKAWNWHKGQKATEAQKIFRIRMTAFLFGALHLTNPKPLIANVIQSLLAGTDGIAFGHIAELTGSIAPTIFLHGLNNGCVEMSFASKISLISMIALTILLKVGIQLSKVSILYVANKGGFRPFLSSMVHNVTVILTKTQKGIVGIRNRMHQSPSVA